MPLTHLDPDQPLLAFQGGAEHGYCLEAHVCQGPDCSLRHLGVQRASRLGAGRVAVEGPTTDLHLDPKTGRLAANYDAGRALLAEAPWLDDWIAERREHIDVRFARLEGRRRSPDGRADVAPPWDPGATVAYAELYPFEPVPLLTTDAAKGEAWMVIDAHCPDPSCACREAHLELRSLQGRTVEVGGVLGAKRPHERGREQQALWAALHRDEELVARLEEHRARVRALGPWMVANHFEAERRRSPLTRVALERDVGYLEHPSVTEAAVGFLFEAAVEFGQARPWDLDGASIALRVGGALAWEGALAVVADEEGFVLHAEGKEIWLTLELREEVSLESRRQRVQAGWPLVDGVLLPVVEVQEVDAEELRAPALEELLLPSVVARALARARARLEHADGEGIAHTQSVTVELPAGVLGPASQVEVTFTLDALDFDDADDDAEHRAGPDAEHSADLGDEEDEFDEDDELDEDDWLDGEDDDPRAELRAAAVDLAFHRGATLAEAAGVAAVAEQLDSMQLMLGDPTPMWSAKSVSFFLRSVASSAGPADRDALQVFPPAIDRLIDAIELGGYPHAPELRRALRSSGRELGSTSRAALTSSSTPRAPEELGPAGPGRDRERWVRGPDEPLPADRDPCPCGSGRRFKKCCKPR